LKKIAWQCLPFYSVHIYTGIHIYTVHGETGQAYVTESEFIRFHTVDNRLGFKAKFNEIVNDARLTSA